MRFAIVVGTRPELIKMAPVIRAAMELRLDFRLVHSGQHYDEAMDKMVFAQFDLPQPDVNLGIGSGTHAITTSRILKRLEPYVQREHIGGVLVHGDTNTTLGAALVSAKLNLPIGHVEAGLRSFDRTMPEEINRIVVDHIATHLFAPTHDAVDQLHHEGIQSGIVMTGQTAVDALEYLRPRLKKTTLVTQYGLDTGKYFFMTCHRQENTDDKDKLLSIFEEVEQVAVETKMQIAFPVHPRTKLRLQQYGHYDDLCRNPRFLVIDPPCDYFTSLVLQLNARLILTDSGGIQEEACILGIPCVTLRENTERPETVEMGANVLAYGGNGSGDAVKQVGRIRAAVEKMLATSAQWEHGYGDGKSSYRILSSFVS